MRPATVLVGGGLLALVAGCGRGPEQPERPPCVLLVVLDTVRADRLGCYGGPAGATPSLDAFAAGADRYRACMATAPWTLPSHASMFTGLFPVEHGTHGFRVDEYVDNVHPLHPDHVTLAEELRGAGYDTAAFVGNRVYMTPRHGVDQGFDTYEVLGGVSGEVFDRALEHLDARGDDRPWFLFVNVMDAHRVYKAYSDAEFRDLPREESPDLLLDRLAEQVMGRGEAPGALGEKVLGLYDRAITRQDAELGRFLAGLAERGALDATVVVITSDHGESFGSHGAVEHAKELYEPLVGVPLVVRAPGQREGRVVDRVGSGVDVPGLVARHVPGAAGEALAATFPRVPGNHPVLAEVHYARPRDLRYGERFQRARTALREGDLKLVLGGDAPELYDLAADPAELVDLAGARPDDVLRMTRTVDAFAAEHRYRGERLAPRPLDGAQRRAMNSLGYGPSGDGR